MSRAEPNSVEYQRAWDHGFWASRMAMLLWFQGVLQECISSAGQYDDTRAVQDVLRQVQNKIGEEFP